MGVAKYQDWLTPDALLLLRGWARDGLTDEQLARRMGVAAATVCEWKKKYPEFAEALQKGREVVDYEVENALLTAALGGNLTAIVFWLKNRRPDVWREKPQPKGDAEAAGGGVIVLAPVEDGDGDG